MVPKKTLSSEKTNKRCALFTKCFQQLVFFHPRAVFLLPRCSCTTNTDSNIILQGLTKLSLSGRHRVSHPQICTVQFVGFICWLNKSSSLSAWRGKILLNEQSSHTLLTCAYGVDVGYITHLCIGIDQCEATPRHGHKPIVSVYMYVQ